MSDNDKKPLTEEAINEWMKKADGDVFRWPEGTLTGDAYRHIHLAVDMLNSALAEIAELRDRLKASQRDADIDYQREKERADKAEAQLADERGARAMDLAMLSKAEAERDSALSLMRAKEAEAASATARAEAAERRRKEVRADAEKAGAETRKRAEKAEAEALARLQHRLERQAAEEDWGPGYLNKVTTAIQEMVVEKPAEPVTQIGSIDDDAITEGVRQAEAGETIPVEDLIEEVKDREGDDVLRNWYESMEDPCKWDHDELLARMGLRELCRRALGEER